MRKLYKRIHEGVGFSHNGHRAYLRGEKPKWLFEVGDKIQPTFAHHVELKQRRALVMFFRKVT